MAKRAKGPQETRNWKESAKGNLVYRFPFTNRIATIFRYQRSGNWGWVYNTEDGEAVFSKKGSYTPEAALDSFLDELYSRGQKRALGSLQ